MPAWWKEVGSLLLNFYRDLGYIFSHGKVLHVLKTPVSCDQSRAKQLPLAKKIFLFSLIRIKAKSVSDGVENRLSKQKVASVGGLLHFKPSVQCPLLALSGHFYLPRECPLLGVKRTLTNRCSLISIIDRQAFV